MNVLPITMPKTRSPWGRRAFQVVSVLAAALGAAASTARAQVSFGAPVLLGPGPALLGQGGIAIARAIDGRCLAVWSDNRTGDQDVYGVLISPVGTVIGSTLGFRIAGGAGSNQGDPRVAACGNVFLVVWGNGAGDGDTTDLFATRVNSNGAILDVFPIVISNQPGVQHNQRQPASDGVDTFLVSFRTASDSVYGGINTMRVSASTGATLDPPGGFVLAMGNDAEGLKKNASVSFGGGQFLVTWDDGRELCQYPGENGCIDIFGAFVDPAGGLIGVPFPTTRAFSCQEGSRSFFDGQNFLVVHSDERATNCSTADLVGERVTQLGQVLDPVDPTGMLGGLTIASDPLGFPGSVQLGPSVAGGACGWVVTYFDTAVAPPSVALRMKRLRPDGTLEGSQNASQLGTLITAGMPSPGVNARAELVEISTNMYVLAYALNSRPTIRTATFSSPIARVVGQNALNRPTGVAVDSAGKIYVADTANNRVRVFDNAGALQFGFGTSGVGNGQFNDPRGIAVDGSGNIIVADSGNDRIQVFDNLGAFRFKIGTSGSGSAQFHHPYSAVIGPGGDIYVADTDNHRVQVFSPAGVFKFKFGTFGTGPGQFQSPRAIAFGPGGKIFVVDRDANRVLVFSAGGVYSSQIGGGIAYPRGIAFDPIGRLFVSSGGNDRIFVFTSPLQAARMFGTYGSNPGQFDNQAAIAIDSIGRLYVADEANNRIEIFDCIP